MKYLIFLLAVFIFSCHQKSYDHSTTTIDLNNLNVRIQNSKSVIDTMADLPLQFSVLKSNVDKNKYCTFMTDTCGTLRFNQVVNSKLAEGDTVKTQKLSRFADFETRGYTREEKISFLSTEKLSDGIILHMTSDSKYTSFNYNDELLKQDHFFSDVINESTDFDQTEKKDVEVRLQISKSDCLLREFLIPELDPRNDSFLKVKCEVRSAKIFEKYDFGNFKLDSDEIESLLKTQITKGDVYCGEAKDLILIGQGTKTIQEVSTSNGKTILVGVGQVLFKNEDIILDNGKRIKSSTFKVNDLPK